MKTDNKCIESFALLIGVFKKAALFHSPHANVRSKMII